MGLDGSGQYRVSKDGDKFTLSAGGVVVAVATPKEEVFQLKRPGALASENYLVPVDGSANPSVAILNRALDSIVQLTFEGSKGTSISATVETGLVSLRLMLRRDGEIGVHLINGDGAVVLFASQDQDSNDIGLDLLLMRPNPELLPMGYFGIIVALMQYALK